MALGTLTGFVWGPINPEDVVPIPDTPWVVTSGMVGNTVPLGHLYIVDVRDLSCTELFPYAAQFQLDSARFGHTEPIDPRAFEPHGIDVTVRADGTVEVLVVNHGGRESVEAFELTFSGARPTATWIGGVVLPEFASGNDVAAIAGGGFVVTNIANNDGSMQEIIARMAAGEETGCVLEWMPHRGWITVPGSAICSANGVAVSPDGKWLYIGGWSSRCVRMVSRGIDPVEIRTVSTDILVDNLTWTRDGRLLAAGGYDTTMDEFLAGHYGTSHRLGLPSRVIRIDPHTLAIETIVEYGAETFGVATTGVHVGDEIWVGAARDQGVARFTVPN